MSETRLRAEKLENEFPTGWPNEFPYEDDGPNHVKLQHGQNVFRIEKSLEGVMAYVLLSNPPVKMVQNGNGFIIKVPEDKEYIGPWIGRTGWHVKLLTKLAGCTIAIKGWEGYWSSTERKVWEDLQELRRERARQIEGKARVKRYLAYLKEKKQEGTLMKLTFTFPKGESHHLADPIAEDYDLDKKFPLDYHPTISAGGAEFHVSRRDVSEDTEYWCETVGEIRNFGGTTLRQDVRVLFPVRDWAANLQEIEVTLESLNEAITRDVEKMMRIQLPE